MTSSIPTNTLPPDLAARFKALRSTPSSQSSVKSDEILEERLKGLEPPTEEEVEKGVPVQVNEEGDEAVARFLESLELNSTPLDSEFPPLPRQRLSTLAENSLDYITGVEIQFMRRPSLGAVTGVSQFESEEDSEEGELMRRMRDELDIEDSTRKRREEGVGEWEKRFEGLKGVGEGGGRIGGVPLGEAPELGELEREVERRRKREKGKGSESEGTDTSEEEEETESDSENETGN